MKITLLAFLWTSLCIAHGGHHHVGLHGVVPRQVHLCVREPQRGLFAIALEKKGPMFFH